MLSTLYRQKRTLRRRTSRSSGVQGRYAVDRSYDHRKDQPLRSSQTTSRKMAATKRILYKCFAGQLTESDVDKYLEAFEANGMIQMDRQSNGDARLELPYQGNVDVFDVRLDQTKRKYTRYELFRKGSVFSKALEEKIWDKNKTTNNRLQIVACSSETNSLKTRLEELRAEIAKSPYKIGLLVVTIAEASQYATMQTKLKEIAEADATGRLIICIAKEPLTDERLDQMAQSNHA